MNDCCKAGIDSVVTNDRQVSRAVIECLLTQGHRRFLYLGGPRGNHVETECHKGVRQALAGRDECQLTHINGDFHFNSGTTAADTWLGDAERPTAVFCASDDMAIASLRRVSEAGVRVPGGGRSGSSCPASWCCAKASAGRPRVADRTCRPGASAGVL